MSEAKNRRGGFGPGGRGNRPGGPRSGAPVVRNRAQSARDAVTAGGPVVRKGVVRLPPEIAARVRAGHPWIYREVLQARPLREPTGAEVELVDAAGEFVAR